MNSRTIGLWVGLLGFAALLWGYHPDPAHPQVGAMLAVVFLMATWWITEAVPLAATSLIPLVAFPVLGILPGKEVAPNFFNSTIFLFLGGFLLALAMEKWQLHRRIALHILLAAGRSASGLVLGFMLAAAFLSMWISNTATALMMLPMAMGVLARLEEAHGKETVHPLAVGLMLGLAYACSIGGISTLIGTPTNLVLRQVYADLYPGAGEIGFGSWMVVGVPLALAMLLFAWLLLTRWLFRAETSVAPPLKELREELRSLGRLQREEAIVLAVFILTIVLWMTRDDLILFGWVIPGWAHRFFPPGWSEKIDDATVGIFMVLVLFLLPARSGKGRILEEAIFAKVPWSIVILFGGGFALAKGFAESGLSAFLADKLFSDLGGLPPWVIVVLICASMTIITEFTSNVASTQLVLPLLAALAAAQNLPPLLLMLPATFSASMAFMLPVATPPNAVVFGSGRLRIADMCRAGLFLNLAGVILITLATYFLAPPLWQPKP